jgi:hypothetical protein
MRIFFSGLCIFALAACTSGPQGIRVVNGGTSAIPQKEGLPITTLGADQVRQAVTGKTFQYTRPDGTGFVSYSGDGTFQYQDDKAGAGNGRWTVNGGQYCEAYGSKPMECGVFKNTGDAFFAANSRLVEMKV